MCADEAPMAVGGTLLARGGGSSIERSVAASPVRNSPPITTASLCPAVTRPFPVAVFTVSSSLASAWMAPCAAASSGLFIFAAAPEPFPDGDSSGGDPDGLDGTEDCRLAGF